MPPVVDVVYSLETRESIIVTTRGRQFETVGHLAAYLNRTGRKPFYAKTSPFYAREYIVTALLCRIRVKFISVLA